MENRNDLMLKLVLTIGGFENMNMKSMADLMAEATGIYPDAQEVILEWLQDRFLQKTFLFN